MINPVSSAASTPALQPVSQRTAAPPQEAHSQPQDTVTLSKAAGGSGDVDHDGDSH